MWMQQNGGSGERCGYTCGLLLFVFGFICTAVGTAYCFKEILRVLGGVSVAVGILLTLGGIAVCVFLKRTPSKQHFLDDHSCPQVPHECIATSSLPRQNVTSKYINQQHLQQQLIIEQQSQQPGVQNEQPGVQNEQLGMQNQQLGVQNEQSSAAVYCQMNEAYSGQPGSTESAYHTLPRQHRAAVLASSHTDQSRPHLAQASPSPHHPSSQHGSMHRGSSLTYSEQRRAAYAHHHHASAPISHHASLSLAVSQAAGGGGGGEGRAFTLDHGKVLYAQVSSPASAPASASCTPQHPGRGKPPPRAYLQAEQQQHSAAAQPLILQPDRAMDDSVPPAYDVASYYSPRKT